MAKQKLAGFTGNDINLEYRERSGDYVDDISITLRSTTPITLSGKTTHFEWEGQYNGETISVRLLKGRLEGEHEITGSLPNKTHPQRGHISTQVHNEIRRIIRQFD